MLRRRRGLHRLRGRALLRAAAVAERDDAVRRIIIHARAECLMHALLPSPGR